ncbi:MAG TPA: CBS domain-containing protein [Mariprofundaceae bacterium]|nr:CBS domain-containing protein [Mariprofundaceae bacterium]
MKITSGIEHAVAMLDEGSSALEAARLMTDKFIGSVVVTSHSRVVGIFTERELMMQVVGKDRDPAQVRVGDVMHTDHLKVRPDASCDEALQLMKQQRSRHLLVFDGDRFIGLLSLRDIVVLTLKEKDDLIGQLQHYIAAA